MLLLDQVNSSLGIRCFHLGIRLGRLVNVSGFEIGTASGCQTLSLSLQLALSLGLLLLLASELFLALG